MPRSTTLLLRPATGLTLVLAAAYAVLLLPGVRPSPGYVESVDWWLNMTVDGLVVAVLVLRILADPRGRAAWSCMTLGLVAAFAGSTAYFAHYRHLDPIPQVSWADAGWLVFYLLLAVGLVLRLRARARRMPPSLSLDGLIAGLTAAALAENYVDGAQADLGGADATLLTAYPIGDLLLLAVAVAALAMLGRAGGLSWWLLGASFVTFFVTDAVYAGLVEDDAYVSGSPVDLGWLLARLLLMGAALASLRPTEFRTVDLEGVSVLVLPGVCALAVLGMLFHGSRTEISPVAAVLALCAGVLMVGRTALTFRELRALTEARQRALSERLVEAQDDERARIAADVHDDSVQALAAVDLRLGALRNRLRGSSPEEARAVEAAQDTVHAAAVRLRHLLFELETPVLDATLAEGLRDAAAHVFEESGVTWSVEERGRSPLPSRCVCRPTGSPAKPWSTPASTPVRAASPSSWTPPSGASRCTSWTTDAASPRPRRPGGPDGGTRGWSACVTGRRPPVAGGGRVPVRAGPARTWPSSCRCRLRRRACYRPSRPRTTSAAPGTPTTRCPCTHRRSSTGRSPEALPFSR